MWRCVQGEVINDLRDMSRERLERTFNTNIVAMFTLTQVSSAVDSFEASTLDYLAAAQPLCPWLGSADSTVLRK